MKLRRGDQSDPFGLSICEPISIVKKDSCTIGIDLLNSTFDNHAGLRVAMVV